MSLNEMNEPMLINDRAPKPGSAEDKLQKSLAYRSEQKADATITPDRLGTAERRPRRGMIYDAPLGLKF